ncbi:MAG: hypothetical protein A3J74_05360 [Elusimicrobia bacterium RIFCSPHIGHO2_02_FULL_57_9]|nr:MAG: hypothetical protein A3J74_05360 [Elusimicrobia bacterium RIFCSPHIGHO2_02_FULL_57_9]
MRKLRWFFILACGLAPVSGSAGADGQAYYNSLNCSACHRIGHRGGSSAPDLTLVGLRHNRRWLDAWLKNPSAWKKDALMPDPRLADKTRQAMVDYLASLKGEAFGSAAPWNSPKLRFDPVGRGKIIYERAGCIACHGKDGRNGAPNNNVADGRIPALNGVSQTYTKGELIKLIIRGKTPERRDPNGPEPLIAMPAWGQVLKEEDLEAVIEYLFSLRPDSTPDF